MFNPKQALEKIRKSKAAKQETIHFLTQNINSPSLFPEHDQLSNAENQSFQLRLSKLEGLVGELSGELKSSKEVVDKLKRQNGTLETQVLKLQYENSQLRNSSKVSELRKGHTSQSKISMSNVSHHSHTEQEEKKNQSILMNEEIQHFCPEVEEAIRDIRKEPMQNILRRKQYNFRALKSDQRNLQSGNKYLRELANIEKDYNKSLKKPILLIKLDTDDFQ